MLIKMWQLLQPDHQPLLLRRAAVEPNHIVHMLDMEPPPGLRDHPLRLRLKLPDRCFVVKFHGVEQSMCFLGTVDGFMERLHEACNDGDADTLPNPIEYP